MIGRYQTESMRRLWDEAEKLTRWTAVELAACEAWAARGAIPATEMQALRDRLRSPSPDRVKEIEKTTEHDVVAFVRALGESVGEPLARHLHRGLTSSDVVDTALALAVRDSLDVIVTATGRLQRAVLSLAVAHKTTVCVGRTHGIHAEPTSFGLKLLGFYTEIGRHLERLSTARAEISVGKLSGAVGNFSQSDPELESDVMRRLGLVAEPVATQVVPRDRHAAVFLALALLAGGLERLATEIRALQRTDTREVEEPFGKGQTGSSAMPHKRNPVITERVCGLSRLVRGYTVAELESTALWHERDISHSSVERVIFPDVFHALDYMLERLTFVMSGLRVFPEQMRKNLERTRGLVFSQNVLGALLDAGTDRQAAYAIVQTAAMQVWEDETKTLREVLAANSDVRRLLSEKALASAFDVIPYLRHVDALFRRAGVE
jgi:adenylosuccinate lyase